MNYRLVVAVAILTVPAVGIWTSFGRRGSGTSFQCDSCSQEQYDSIVQSLQLEGFEIEDRAVGTGLCLARQTSSMTRTQLCISRSDGLFIDVDSKGRGKWVDEEYDSAVLVIKSIVEQVLD